MPVVSARVTTMACTRASALMSTENPVDTARNSWARAIGRASTAKRAKSWPNTRDRSCTRSGNAIARYRPTKAAAPNPRCHAHRRAWAADVASARDRIGIPGKASASPTSVIGANATSTERMPPRSAAPSWPASRTTVSSPPAVRMT